MIIAQTTPYLRRKNHFTRADHWGALVARQDLIRASLEHGTVEGVHFFLPSSIFSSEATLALKELQQDFPHHIIEVKPLAELFSLAKRYQYVFPGEIEISPRLAQAREAKGGNTFPLSPIVHTIISHTPITLYLEIQLFAETYDVLVVTSETANRTVAKIFEGTTEYLKSKLGAKLTSKVQLAKIPLGVDERFLKSCDVAASRAELDIPSDSIVILYLGRLSEESKADLGPLLLAFRRLTLESPTIFLVIAGLDENGKYSQILRDAVSELGIIDRVSILTNFPFARKPLIYSAADIFVSPVDNIQETFGLAVLEAMSCGLPVIASDWSGYRDIVLHGETGLLVKTTWNLEAGEWADSDGMLQGTTRKRHVLGQQTVVDIEEMYQYMRLLINNDDLRHRLGKSGRERVLSNFCWPVVMKQFNELWGWQWLQLRKTKESNVKLRLHYNDLYSHFATAAISFDTNVQSNSSYAQLQCGFVFDEARLPLGVTANELKRVLASTQLPTSIGHLISAGNETTIFAIGWLLKKGLLVETHAATCG